MLPETKENDMRYMLLIHEDERTYEGPEGEARLAEVIGRHGAFADSLGEKMLGGAGLKPAATATVVRTRAGAQSVHDGPFAEAREQLGGFYQIEADDLDEAIDIARRLPLAGDGAVEIRPLLDEA